jgi:hypothetical protein
MMCTPWLRNPLTSSRFRGLDFQITIIYNYHIIYGLLRGFWQVMTVNTIINYITQSSCQNEI